MERYYDFDALRSAMARAVEGVAKEAGLAVSHPLMTYAALDVLAAPLWQLKAHGRAIATSVGRAGLDAHHSSILARRVEVLKSPHSRIVNGVMDEIVDALAEGIQPFITHPEAFSSAVEYLIEGRVIERTTAGDLRLVEDAK